MKLLGIDLETTGLDLEKDRITEIGAVLWDSGKQAPVEILSSLVVCHDTPELSEEIVKLTGITQGMLADHAEPIGLFLPRLSKIVEKCDYIVAHNGLNFDKPILERAYKTASLPLWPRTWIDTRTDIVFPDHIKARSLIHLAAEHGFVNPFAHRAVFDVCAMMKVLAHYDLAQVIQYAKAPTIEVRAMVDYNSREQAKERRYRWNGEQKIWTKTIKDFQLEQEIKEAPFKVLVLSSTPN